MTEETSIAERRRQSLQWFMDRKGLNPYRWGKAARVSEGTIRNFLAGRTDSLNMDTQERLAAAAKVSVAQLWSGGVPIVGFVNALGEVARFDAAEGELERVECPAGFEADELEAYRVTEGAMPGAPAGWLIFARRDPSDVSIDCLDRFCVVHRPDGRLQVRTVRRGYAAGRYNLVSPTGATEDDAELSAAAKIVWTMQP